jgi:hypothetical protein
MSLETRHQTKPSKSLMVSSSSVHQCGSTVQRLDVLFILISRRFLLQEVESIQMRLPSSASDIS